MPGLELLTSEQREFVDFACSQECNMQSTCCIVQSFAGCGKTSALCTLVEQRYERGLGSCLLVTITAELKKTLRNVAQKQNGLVVENVHSLIRNQLWRGHECLCADDIRDFLNLTTKPPINKCVLEHVTMIVFDEIQNMDAMSYEVIVYLLQSLSFKPVLFVGMGNYFQWLFGTLTSGSTKYMCNPEKYFQAATYRLFRSSWSLRLTHDMCEWINQKLNPLKIQAHFTECWEEHGTNIQKFWGDGIHSLKCKSCKQLHTPTTTACMPDCSNKDIRYFPNHNRFKSLLPQYIDHFMQTHETLILVNGVKRTTFEKQYMNVGTPFSHIGCEARHVVVVGFDKFTETVCRQKSQNDIDWPLSLYCQMHVACTRASVSLFLVGYTATELFTLRDTPLHLAPRMQKTLTTATVSPTILTVGTTMIPNDTELVALCALIECVQVDYLSDMKFESCCITNTLPTNVAHAIQKVLITHFRSHLADKNVNWHAEVSHLFKGQCASSNLLPPPTWFDRAMHLFATVCQHIYGVAPLPTQAHGFHYSHFVGDVDVCGTCACLFVNTNLTQCNSNFMLFTYIRYLLFKKSQARNTLITCYVLNVGSVATLVKLHSRVDDDYLLFQFLELVHKHHPHIANPITVNDMIMNGVSLPHAPNKKMKT